MRDEPYERILSNVFSRLHEEHEVEELDNFLIHMSDWIEDMKKLYQVINDPNSMSEKEKVDAVVGLLLHAPPHLMAALLTYDREEKPAFVEAKLR